MQEWMSVAPSLRTDEKLCLELFWPTVLWYVCTIESR